MIVRKKIYSWLCECVGLGIMMISMQTEQRGIDGCVVCDTDPEHSQDPTCVPHVTDSAIYQRTATRREGMSGGIEASSEEK